MIAFCGFNAFGQFGSEHGEEVEHFKDVSFKVSDEYKILQVVSPAWSYTAYSFDKTLVLRGFLGGQKDKVYTHDFDARIIEIASCDHVCLILLIDGRVYDIQPQYPLVSPKVIFPPSLDDGGPNDRVVEGNLNAKRPIITHIACGAKISVAISDENVVYSIPNPIYQFEERFRPKQLVCGLEHAMVLSHNGDIMSWGNGLRGQLGLDVACIKEKPTLIAALAGIKIICIAAGGWHSAAISEYGDVYTWGSNSIGQLGLSVCRPTLRRRNCPGFNTLPQIVPIPDCYCGTDKVEGHLNCFPDAIMAGTRHTVFKRSCGTVFVTGENKYGQLSIGKSIDFLDYFQILPHHDSTADYICGSWCTIMMKKS